MRLCEEVTAVLLLVTYIGLSDGSCPAGTFRRVVSSWDSTEWLCIPCAAGGWSPSANSLTSDMCWSCPVNTYSHIGASYCTPCPGSTRTAGPRSWASHMCKPLSTGIYTKYNSTTPKVPVDSHEMKNTSTTPKAPVESDVLSGSHKMNIRSTLPLLLTVGFVVVLTATR